MGTVPRRTVLLVAALSAVAALTCGPVAAAASPTPSAVGDRYVNNPPEDAGLTDYCADETELANNLERKADHDRALNVVGTANMRGCRIYTFRA